MVWARIDDKVFEHQKVRDLSKDAKLLFFAAIARAARHESDGRLTPQLLRWARADADAGQREIDELVASGLFEVRGEDHWVHDFLDYNPSSEQLQGKRDANAERQRRWREDQRNASRNGVTADRHSVTNDPYPLSRNPVVTQEPDYPEAPAEARARECVREALATACGQPETDDEQDDFEQTVKQLVKARAAPAAIAGFPSWWYEQHPKAALTHRCFRRHWGRYANAPPRPPQLSDIKNPGLRSLMRMKPEDTDDPAGPLPTQNGRPAALPAGPGHVRPGGRSP